MRTLTLGSETDTKLLMNLIRVAEANRDRFCIINLLSSQYDSHINKRFVRQALFSDECITALIHEDGECVGFIILVNDTTSNLQSNPLLVMVSELHGETILKPDMMDTVGLKKIRCVLTSRSVAIEKMGFELEGSLEMKNSTNYFYALMSERLLRHA